MTLAPALGMLSRRFPLAVSLWPNWSNRACSSGLLKDAPASPPVALEKRSEHIKVYFVYHLTSEAKKQCWGSVTFWCGSADLYLQLQIWHLSSVTFNDAKNWHYFLIAYPQAHYLQSSVFIIFHFIFLREFSCKILFYKHYFSLLKFFIRNGKDPKTCGSGSGSPTLLKSKREIVIHKHPHAKLQLEFKVNLF